MDTSGENGSQHFKLDKTFNLGNILTVIVLLITFVIAWERMDSRVANVERWEIDHQVVFDKTTATLDKLDNTLNLLQQRLADYPLHKHVGSEVVYPGSEPTTEIPTTPDPETRRRK